MERDPRKELLTILEAELVASGFPSRRKIRNLMRAIAQGKAPKGSGFADGLLAAIAAGIYKTTEKRKFKNQDEVDNWREQLKVGRHQLRPTLTKFLKKIKGMTPRRGGPGRNSRFNESEKRKICSTIGTYIANGMTVTDAVEQIAKEKCTGTRTIWKAWGERPKKPQMGGDQA